LYVYLQAYQQGEDPIRPLLGYVTFYRDGRKSFESGPTPAGPAATNRLRTRALEFSIPLPSLPPGEYDCQVTVLETQGGKAAFWQSPVMIAP
jgi:hypothetical protein